MSTRIVETIVVCVCPVRDSLQVMASCVRLLVVDGLLSQVSMGWGRMLGLPQRGSSMGGGGMMIRRASAALVCIF